MKCKIRLDGQYLETTFENGAVNRTAVNELKDIEAPSKRRMKMGEYVFLRMIQERKMPPAVDKEFGFGFDNQGHRNRCLFEANVLGVHPDVVLLACAELSYLYNYTPEQE